MEKNRHAVDIIESKKNKGIIFIDHTTVINLCSFTTIKHYLILS